MAHPESNSQPHSEPEPTSESTSESSESKLTAHGFQFRNWPGPGEAAAAHFGLSHAVIVPPNARTVIIGGQLGIRDDGTVPEDIAEEVAEAFDHVTGP